MAILNHTSTSVETPPRKPPEPPARSPMEPPSAAAVLRWSKRDTILLLLILLIAGGLRILRLAEPNAVVFDETYYAKDACLYLGHSQDFCKLDQGTEQSYVHPPLGKWLLSLGISAFGYNSFGWRFSAAIFGTAMAGLAFLIARRLFGDRWTAGAAGLLVGVDFLLIVQSRIAMLDIFLAFFILLGFWFVVLDRERALTLRSRLTPPLSLPAGKEERSSSEQKQREPEARPDADPPGRGLRWRLAAGAAFGLAVAVKWSAALALVAAAVCALFWSLELLVLAKKHRAKGYGARRRAPLAKEVLVSFAAFCLVPGMVYLAAYGAYFVDRFRQECPFSVPGSDRLFDSGLLGQPEGKCIKGIPGIALSFADLQDRIFDYHASLTAKHSYQSKAWTWPLVLRPVAYFYETEEGNATEVMAIGNVAAWYAALLALPWLIARSLKKWRPERLVLVAWGAQYLPWLLVPRPLFFFYMTPVVPFMMIGLAWALNGIRRRWSFGRALTVFYLVIAAGVMLILFYPVVAGVPLPHEWWEKLMWIPQFDCGGFMCGWI